MSTARMLITGGSGYLGRWVAELARDEWDVTATYGRMPGELDGVEWRALDVRDGAAVATLIEDVTPDVVVHTAALNPGQGNDFEGVNVTGTANIAAAAAHERSRLVHVSTDIVFDGQRGNYGEHDEPHPLNDYGRSKAAAERAIADSGAEAVVVRTSLIYGWRPTVARAAQWMIDALRRGETIRLWSDEMRCPIWVESLAAALVELAGHEYTGPLHVAGSEPLSRYEFGVALLRFHGVDPGPVSAEPLPGDRQRPRDCTLDISRAVDLLDTPLPGVTEVLSGHRR
jgi:dTDP-4-dehydrorhamnose reductase